MNEKTKTAQIVTDADTLESFVFQTLGAASICWSETPKGIFDSDRAKLLGDQLMERIQSDGTASIVVAIKTLTDELRADEEYRYGWQANIAMAFYDHVRRSPEFSRNEPLTHNRLHELANGAAIAFLEMLAPTREMPDVPGAMAVAMVHAQSAEQASRPAPAQGIEVESPQPEGRGIGTESAAA